jgi:Tol biopolymer transport system component
MVIALVLAVVSVMSIASGSADTPLTFGAPQKIVPLDKIKGEPIQLAWSPDGSELYVETGNRTRVGTFVDQKHYLATMADRKVKSLDAPPQWATDYQTWKSSKWAPGDRAYVIDISEETRTQRAISAPMGGDLAKGGASGASQGNMDDAVSASLTSQAQHVITLKLKGEIVGQIVDTQFVPGYTFSWAPQSFGTAIAYARPDGRLAVMTRDGTKQEVPDTRNTLLPAWSADGKQIAFVQRNGKKFELFVTQVTGS